MTAAFASVSQNTVHPIPRRVALSYEEFERLSVLAPAVNMYLKAVERRKFRRDRKTNPILNDCGTMIA
jgi:hypothetical protein